ncbi:hypothetical protein HY251_02080, partial [bacterium]|nr:hypothetical protein [bacterium]
MLFLVALVATAHRVVERPIPPYWNSQQVVLWELGRTWCSGEHFSGPPVEWASMPAGTMYYGPGPLPFVATMEAFSPAPFYDPALGLVTAIFNAGAIAALGSVRGRGGARQVILGAVSIALSLKFLAAIWGDYYDHQLHHDAFTVFYGVFWPSFLARLTRLDARRAAVLVLAFGGASLGKPHLVLLPV